MYIYPVLIAISKIATIWVTSRVAKKVLLSSTQILVLMVIIKIHKNNSKPNDKT
jgi:hypothetical protein